MIMMMIRIESCDKAMIVIQWIINTFRRLIEIFLEVYFLPIIACWCYAESPSADCCELWFNTNWILFQCIFSKCSIFEHSIHGTSVAFFSFSALLQFCAIQESKKRALRFCAVGFMINNLTLLVFISSDLFKRCCNHYIYLSSTQHDSADRWW